MLWQWLGTVPFEQADRLNQQDMLATQRDGLPRLLAFEPAAPALTYGLRPDALAQCGMSAEQLDQRGIVALAVRRGGQATLHLPGQLVVLVALRVGPAGVRALVCQLLGVTQAVATTFGTPAVLRADHDAGLWVGSGLNPAKLSAIGLHVAHGVAGHGLALNVAVDPAATSGLTLCGHADARYASLAPVGTLAVAAVAAAWHAQWLAAGCAATPQGQCETL